jgi:hypothetical protein
MVKHISAVIVVSNQAPVVAAFYRDRLGIPLEDEQHGGGGEVLHYGCTLGGLHFAVHPVENWPYAEEVGPGGAVVGAVEVDGGGTHGAGAAGEGEATGESAPSCEVAGSRPGVERLRGAVQYAPSESVEPLDRDVDRLRSDVADLTVEVGIVPEEGRARGRAECGCLRRSAETGGERDGQGGAGTEMVHLRVFLSARNARAPTWFTPESVTRGVTT